MDIKCRFSRLIFKAEDSGFAVALYKSLDSLKTPDGRELTTFKGVSNSLLPITPSIDYTITGDWELSKSKNGDYDYQFKVTSYEEPRPNTKEALIKYLATLSGIGKVTAKRIYDEFGDNTLSILESDPDKLLKVKGIRDKSLDKIKTSLIERGAGKELFVYLYSFGIPAFRIYQIYNRYKTYALDKVKENPYELIQIAGIGFVTADKIAHGNNLPLDSDQRIRAGVNEILLQSENGGQLFRKIPSGNTYLEWQLLCSKTFELLGQTLSYDRLANICIDMAKDKELYVGSNKYFYRYKSYLAEYGIAQEIIRLNKTAIPNKDYSTKITEAEEKIGVKLAELQKKAVQECLTSPITVITGGPGTGKTMIERIVLDVYTKTFPQKSILLCSPTGRAARRMTESTGRSASTIHQALGLYASVDSSSFTSYDKPKVFDDLVIVDEVSMLDTYLAHTLFAAIQSGSQVVLIGDANQLPSVGPGCVLKEIINCDNIPVVKLTKIFRQKNGSSIAVNASRINNGTTQMEFDNDFQFIDTKSQEETQEIVKIIYAQEVAEVGVDDVTVLTPFRQKTLNGVDTLNPILRNVVNPNISDTTPKLTFGKSVYYKGDKVMQTKNVNFLANGDIGYVKEVIDTEDGLHMNVDFGFADASYYADETGVLDLAYATTVHKAQGSEYKRVIFVCTPEHKILLRRNLIYTAISRAKEAIIIIGDEKTLANGIVLEDTNKRSSRLAEIVNAMQKKSGFAKESQNEQMAIPAI